MFYLAGVLFFIITLAGYIFNLFDGEQIRNLLFISFGLSFVGEMEIIANSVREISEHIKKTQK